MRIKEIYADTFLLSFERTRLFEAGQVVAVSLSEVIEPRLYSIASGELKSESSILFNIKHEGVFSPQLAKCKPGDPILVSDPFGNFTCREEKAYWIASGTGIAPFFSMIDSGKWQGKTLIHGGRTAGSFFFQDEILPLMNEDYVRCCSQESGSGLYHGRLTKYLQEIENLPFDQKYFLCGSAEMVVDVRDILIAKNIPFENIISEIYF